MKVFTGAAAAVLLMAYAGPAPALADTIEAALVRAYQNNPQLNAQRAQVRVDRRERAAGAVGLSSEGRAHRAASAINTPIPTPPRAARRPRSCEPKFTAPIHRAASASRSRRRCSTATRPPTRPAPRRARSPARAKACGCSNRPCCCRRPRSTWTICATPPSSRFRSSNTRVLEQTLKQTQDRFNVGEVTRTDVAQSEAQLAAGQHPATDRGIPADHHAIEFPPHHRQRTGGIWRRDRRSIASCRQRCRPRSNSA